MVQLKQVVIRLKSINNIQKITKTMKMVSASKFTRAERELAAAVPFGYAPRKFYQSTHLVLGPVDEGDSKEKFKLKDAEQTPAVAAPPPVEKTPEEIEKEAKMRRLYVAVTSDRGLCGGVHSGVARRIRRDLTARGADRPGQRLVCIGDKSRGMLRRTFSHQMLVSVKDIGRTAPVFADASTVAAAIAEAQFTYDIGDIYYNKYHSPVKYELSTVPFFNKDKIEVAPNILMFDDLDPDSIESYAEWTVAALLYYAMKQSAASEQSARMAAMDNATKNANDMIKKLTLLYNRTRQAVITRELIEIISGAAALK